MQRYHITFNKWECDAFCGKNRNVLFTIFCLSFTHSHTHTHTVSGRFDMWTGQLLEIEPAHTYCTSTLWLCMRGRGSWVTCGADMCLVDSAGGEESVLFKARNQSSSSVSALPDTLWPSQSSIRHTLRRACEAAAAAACIKTQAFK